MAQTGGSVRKLRSVLIAGTVFGLVLVAFWSLAGSLHSELVQQQRAHVRDQLLVFRAELANAINTHLQMLAPVADHARSAMRSVVSSA